MNLSDTPTPPQPFGPPHTWCDHRCARCPLRTCPVRLGAIRNDWGERLRGEGTQTSSLRMDDVLHAFRNILSADAGRGATPARQPACHESHRPISKHAPRSLPQAACRLFSAVHDAVKAQEAHGTRHGAAEAGEVLALASLLRCKAAMLTDRAADAETLPSLLLLDTTLRALGQSLPSLRNQVSADTWARVNACHGDLRQALSRQLQDAGAARELLATLVGQRLAPSPFCTV